MSDSKKQEQAFLEAYEKHSDAIFRYCYYRVFDREKAKDIVQDAFMKTWKYISGTHEVEDIKSFLYKVARNIIIDESRKKKVVSLEYISEKGFTPNIDSREQQEDGFMGKEMLEIVNSLDEKYKDAIILKYVEDLSIKEIAVMLSETENNVSVRINRGFKKVKEILRLQEQNNK